MVEVMVVVVLMTFIVLALMAVFSSTQKAFRSSLTQTDVLEGGRSAIDLMTADLRQMTPSFDLSNRTVNFFVGNETNAIWLTNMLVASSNVRTNFAETFFILARGNDDGKPVWSAIAYTVVTNSGTGLYSLYRFSTNHHEMARSPEFLFTNDFMNVFGPTPTLGSHLIDGVVHLAVRAYDTNGVLIQFNQKNVRTNALVCGPLSPRQYVATGYLFYSNTVPAAVEVEMAVLEDRPLQRAESLQNPDARATYISGQGGKLHVFRQRVAIPSIDPSGY